MTNKPNTNYDYWHEQGYDQDLAKAQSTQQPLFNQVIKLLDFGSNDKGKRLLDVACGKGVFLHELQERNFELKLAGLDISEFAVEKAHEYTKADFVAGDAQAMPYERDSFDIATCLGGLEYLPEPKQGAKEIGRVVKPGGKVLIQAPNLMFLGHIYLAWRDGSMPSEGGQSEDKRFYNWEIEKFFTYDGWKTILEDAGLKLIKCEKYNLILGSQKVSPLTKKLFNGVVRHFVPLNLSYCFIMLFEKK